MRRVALVLSAVLIALLCLSALAGCKKGMNRQGGPSTGPGAGATSSGGATGGGGATGPGAKAPAGN